MQFNRIRLLGPLAASALVSAAAAIATAPGASAQPLQTETCSDGISDRYQVTGISCTGQQPGIYSPAELIITGGDAQGSYSCSDMTIDPTGDVAVCDESTPPP